LVVAAVRRAVIVCVLRVHSW